MKEDNEFIFCPDFLKNGLQVCFNNEQLTVKVRKMKMSKNKKNNWQEKPATLESIIEKLKGQVAVCSAVGNRLLAIGDNEETAEIRYLRRFLIANCQPPAELEQVEALFGQLHRILCDCNPDFLL